MPMAGRVEGFPMTAVPAGSPGRVGRCSISGAQPVASITNRTNRGTIFRTGKCFWCSP